MGFNMSSDRVITCTEAILFNRTDIKQCEMAETYRAKTELELMDAGYPPYRLGINSMGKITGPVDEYDSVLFSLKSVLDPHHITSPGYYNVG